MAYVDFDGAEALAAAEPHTAIDEAFLRRYCPNLIKAMDRIDDWLDRV